MAIRELKGRRNPWQCYWNDPETGKRKAINFKTRLEAEMQNSLIIHRLKYERESLHYFGTMPKKQTMTCEKALSLYFLEKGYGKKGLAFQMDAMKPILQKYGNLPIEKMDRSMFLDVLNFLRKPNIKEVTLSHRAGVFRAFLDWCAERGLCNKIIFPALPLKVYEKILPPTALEMEAMLKVAPAHLQRVLILGWYCGMRIGVCELFSLLWEHVDFAKASITIISPFKNKGAPWREIPITVRILPFMRIWKKQDSENNVSHIIHFGKKPVRSIKTAWKTMLQKAGITRRIRPYDLRHAFASGLIANGVDIGTTAKLMGHSSSAMILRHYQYVLDSQKRAAIERVPDICLPGMIMDTKKGLQSRP